MYVTGEYVNTPHRGYVSDKEAGRPRLVPAIYYVTIMRRRKSRMRTQDVPVGL